MEGTVTVGVGLTVTVKLCGVPVQPLAEGVTVIVAVTGIVLLFTAVKSAMLPVPLPVRPIDVSLLVQL